MGLLEFDPSNSFSCCEVSSIVRVRLVVGLAGVGVLEIDKSCEWEFPKEHTTVSSETTCLSGLFLTGKKGVLL